MHLVDLLRVRTFRFGRIDGSAIGIIKLGADGSLIGYRNANEHSWAVEGGRLVFRSTEGQVTTVFDQVSHDGPLYSFRGAFLPQGPAPWHTLTEIPEAAAPGPISELLSELYGGDGPLAHTDPRYTDNGYPHTNLLPDVISSVLETFRPKFWLELGTMLGGSAIRVADAIKALALDTEIVCVDPFTGDVNMWAWEQGTAQKGGWRFLRLERGRPTIYDRFLANVVAAGHADIILPIAATSIVGMKLLRRLAEEGRLSSLPTVIYLDSAHEPGETFLELQMCWELLEPGGVLLGDDWSWDAVRNDVIRFARTVQTNAEGMRRLVGRNGKFTDHEGILLDRGQWVLVK